MKTLILVSGSVAAKLTPKLQKAFQEYGEVKIAVSNNALSFLERGSNVITDEAEGRWRERGDEIAHIALRNWADVIVLAPLSANTLSKIANGAADNLITSIVRAWDYTKPMILAPSMNTLMWENPFTKKHLKTMEKLGVILIDPINKEVKRNHPTL